MYSTLVHVSGLLWKIFKNFFSAIRIDFAETSYTVSEGDAPLEVCAEIMSLMGNLDCDLVVTFSELPFTAGMTIIFCYYMMVQNELKCSLLKEHQWAEHFTTPGWALFWVFLQLTTKECAHFIILQQLYAVGTNNWTITYTEATSPDSTQYSRLNGMI